MVFLYSTETFFNVSLQYLHLLYKQEHMASLASLFAYQSYCTVQRHKVETKVREGLVY